MCVCMLSRIVMCADHNSSVCVCIGLKLTEAICLRVELGLTIFVNSIIMKESLTCEWNGGFRDLTLHTDTHMRATWESRVRPVMG